MTLRATIAENKPAGPAQQKLELVTRSELELRLQDSLRARKLPDYQLYVGQTGRRNWIKLSKSRTFQVASSLTELLREHAAEIARWAPLGLTVMSIGAGDGGKERILLEALRPREIYTYYPVDISSPMVDVAMSAVRDMPISTVGIVAFAEDFPRFRLLGRPPLLVCLLGNNFCNYQGDELLEMFRSHLHEGDLLLLDCHVLPAAADPEQWRGEVEQVYRSQQNVRFNLDPLVRHGMNPSSCEFRLDLLPVATEFGPAYRTRKQIRLLQDATLSFGHEEIRLQAGEDIEMGFTYKYSAQQVEGYLRRHGFGIVESFESAGRDNLLLLAHKIA